MPPIAAPATASPAANPTVLCTSRLTRGFSNGASCCWVSEDSKRSARAISGSPMALANPKATRAAKRPTSSPRVRYVLATRRSSVAGEGEEVAGVVHELVHVVAAHERQGALLDAHE